MKDLLSAYVAKKKAFLATKTGLSKGPGASKDGAKEIAKAILAKNAPKDVEAEDDGMDLDWESEGETSEPDTRDKFDLVKRALEKIR